MKNRPQKLKYCFKNGVYISLTILFFSMTWGCASTHKTTKTETTVTYPNNNRGVIYQRDPEHNRGAVEESEKTTTTTETKTEHPGILSSTLHAIGYVIALPFIIIGGLFRIIFGG